MGHLGIDPVRYGFNKFKFIYTLLLHISNKFLQLSLLTLLLFFSVIMGITMQPHIWAFTNNTKTIPAKRQRIFTHNLWARQKFKFVYNIFVKVAVITESLGYNYSTFFPNRVLW